MYTEEKLLPKIPVYSCLFSVEYISLSLFAQILSRTVLSNLHICLKNQVLNLVIAPIHTVINFKIALSSNPTGTSECY